MSASPRRALLLGLPALANAGRAAAQPAFALGPWQDRWAAVLRARVDDQGRTDFAAIAADPAPLRAVVEGAALGDPARMQGPERLAYLINAYNALAMWGIVQRGIPQRLDLLERFRFFSRTEFRLGGRDITLKALEDDVIRPIGDERIHFALNCMVRGCPRLPREPFRSATLEAQLAAAAREFCESGYQVRPQPESGSAWISQIFQFYTRDFTPARAPSLAAYINRHRRAPLDPTWTMRFFDYDWTVNRQPGAGARDQG